MITVCLNPVVSLLESAESAIKMTFNHNGINYSIDQKNVLHLRSLHFITIGPKLFFSFENIYQFV